MRKSPCKDCEDREDGCHSVCESYKAWRQELEKARDARRMESKIDEVFFRPWK